MKRSILLLLIALPAYIFAQNCPEYFPVKEGMVMEMKHYDAKDKETGRDKTSITDVSGNKISMRTESWDKKGEPVANMEYDVVCDGDILRIDMSKFMDQQSMASFKSMDVEISSNTLNFPSKLVVGNDLEDGELEMKVNSGGTTMMTMNVEITNRKVVGMEKITTPKGTYNAYKITYDINSKMGFVDVSSKGVEYYADGVGILRTESYNKNGKLQSYSVRVQ